MFAGTGKGFHIHPPHIPEGMKADVTVFNPDTVRDAATYEEPAQYAEGISYVMVNGPTE